MTTVRVTQGLPASGKSTYAKSLGILRVSLDDLRTMAGWTSHESWSRDKEDVVIEAMLSMVEAAVESGQDIIVDNTHLHANLPGKIRRRVGGRAKFEAVYFHCPVDEAVKRDAVRENSVGEAVIRKMDKNFKFKLTNEYLNVWPSVEKVTHVNGVPEAIIVDLDGTIARHTERGPFETERCDEDEVSNAVEAAVFGYALTMHQAGWPYKIIFLSGREGTESVRAKTETWLKDKLALDCESVDDYGLTWGMKYELHMRPEGDKRPDFVVKYDLFQEHIRGKYNILFALDDRKSIIRLWTEMGIETLACSSLAKEF